MASSAGGKISGGGAAIAAKRKSEVNDDGSGLTKRRPCATAIVRDDGLASVGSWGFVQLLLLYVGVALCAFALIAFLCRDQLTFAMESYRDDNHGGCGGCRDRGGRDIFGDRRIPPFERDGIVVPDRGKDARDCDDLRQPVECNANEGYVACFTCIESRLSLRVCAHVTRDLTVEDDRGAFTLRANESADRGYCVSESLARKLRGLDDNGGGGDGDGGSVAERCSSYNADWVLARLGPGDDQTHNFVCRCKYPHLMTNHAGPMSACSRDVGCNGHGRLDADSRAQRVDPFVNGRCLCDPRWVAEYDEKRGGPYCREATFAEWPAMFTDMDYTHGLDLYNEAVDSSFREYIESRRQDVPAKTVTLPNPCGFACKLVSSWYRRERVWYCADHVELTGDGKIGRIGLATRRDRDYLAGNGGRYPNACLEIDAISEPETVALQYMSQKWNVGGSRFAQEIGFLVDGRRAFDNLRNLWRSDRAYARFADSLEPARNNAFASSAIVWTYNAEAMADTREELNRQMHDLFLSGASYDPLFNSQTLWFDFPFYCDVMAYKDWFCYVAGSEPPKWTVPNPIGAVPCTDGRGLDWICTDESLGHRRNLSKYGAQVMGYGVVPICWTDAGRPEINCDHPNPTGCVIFTHRYGEKRAMYSFLVAYPRGMDLRHLCCERAHHRRGDTSCGAVVVDHDAVADRRTECATCV